MRAAIFRNGEIVVGTLPEPKPAAGQVLVRTLACGICGSDLHARKHARRMVELTRHFPGRIPMDLARDVVFGHEFCCEVLDYGPGTQRKFKTGTRVCSLPALLTPAGLQTIGYSNDNVGGYAEQMLLSEPLLLEVPNGLAAEHAALTEPLAVGIHAVAKANIRSAQENLALAKIMLGYTSLRAPFSGVILTRQTELGEVMQPGTPVVTLADLDHVWLRAYVAETDLGRIRWGQAATVHTDTYPDKAYPGQISFISSEAEFTPKSVETHKERVTLVYRIKIDVQNPRHELKPGMPADATIHLGAPVQSGNSRG